MAYLTALRDFVEAQGVADYGDLVAALGEDFFVYLDGGQVIAVQVDNGHIYSFDGGEAVGIENPPVAEGNFDFAGPFYHVVIGDNFSLGRYIEAGPLVSRMEGTVPDIGFNADYGWFGFLNDLIGAKSAIAGQEIELVGEDEFKLGKRPGYEAEDD